MADYHTKPLLDVLNDFGSAAEAKARLEHVGANELNVPKDTPEIVKFLLHFKNLFAILLIAVVPLNAVFTYFQKHLSERLMGRYKNMLPSMITALRDGKPQEIPAGEFAPGDAINNNVIGSLVFAIGIVVANVPEGLLTTVTLSLAMASRRMAQKNALIKNLEIVETPGSTTVICTYKIGLGLTRWLSVAHVIQPATKELQMHLPLIVYGE
jgi:magnesium-transporting ATPase (P-type)